VFLGEARFVAPELLRVGEDELRADKFVLAAGSRLTIPARTRAQIEALGVRGGEMRPDVGVVLGQQVRAAHPDRDLGAERPEDRGRSVAGRGRPDAEQ
jgi:hypothetical protein